MLKSRQGYCDRIILAGTIQRHSGDTNDYRLSAIAVWNLNTPGAFVRHNGNLCEGLSI